MFSFKFHTKILTHFYPVLFVFLFSSTLQVLRAMDPSLIHHYHSKACDPKLTREQYIMCVGSVAEGYGSKNQLAKKILMAQKDIK